MTQDNTCVTDCTKCPELVSSRSQIVNGVGPIDADLALVGEGPGANEDEQGVPFVGRSGSVLNDTLSNLDYPREEVRITNTVRCRPPDNRDPRASERENCRPHLERELASVNPKAVLTLGKVPSETLLGESIAITKVAGNTYEKEFCGASLTVVAGLHPAATLYDSSYKDLFEDAVSVAVELCEQD